MTYIDDLLDPLTRRGLPPARLVRGLEWVLVVLLALVLADLAWDLAGAGDSPGAPAPAVPTQAPSHAVDILAARQVSPSLELLFGRPTGEDREIEAPVRETRLNLKLKGILAQDSGMKLALIAAGGGREEVYQVGDEVEGAEIVRIEPRRVILRRDGVTEALNMEVPVTPAGGPGPADVPVGAGRDLGVRRLDDTRHIVSRQTFRRQLSNLPGLLQQATAVPHRENGVPAGFRVVDVQAGSIFQDLGIRPDDVIRAVNGLSIRTPAEALAAYRDLRTSSRFRLDLLRGGRELTLDYTVQ